MEPTVSLSDIEAARVRLSDHLVYTPCVQSKTLSAQLGCELFVKFENLQFTASFKERGALNCLLKNPQEVARGVIAMSAGNHAQALAYHGKRLGIPTTIVMPRITPNAKVEATRLLGAQVILHGAQFDETLQHTYELAKQRGLRLIHPFDECDVIAGQGTVALEMLEQVPGLDAVVVPIGGGGRISGVGCVVKAPGKITSRLIKDWVDDICLVDEQAAEQAIFDLLEIEKTVAEGAGAVGLALLRQQTERFKGKRVAMILSGGNIDMMILSSVLQRGMVRSHRLVRLRVEIPDTPGALADLTHILGELDSNIMEITHQRAFGGSSVRSTLVELVLQMRGEEQMDNVTQVLEKQGYEVVQLH